jgi:effector-binding domain-containing protein
MKFAKRSFATSLALAFSLGLSLSAPLRAQDQPAQTSPATPGSPALTTVTTPAPAAPPTATPPPPITPAPVPPMPVPNAGEPEQGIPGLPSDSTTQTLEVPSRQTAIVTAQAKWDEGFASIKDSLAKIKTAMDNAGLKPAGSPFTVFTQTDDNGFSYQAMVPLAERPPGKDELSPDVKLGSSPSGKAIKFQHRGPYDDIDSTYDLITAYLDEKGLEARDFFIEEYLTDLTSSEDPNLAVDIYVFIKDEP